jgi:uncharacterized protein
MLAYFDSSALVKLLIEEPGSGIALDLWNGAPAISTSRIAHLEVRAALEAARRARRLSSGGVRSAVQLWDRYRRGLRTVEVDELLTDAAAELTGPLALNALDAIHLASAVAVGDTETIVATWDRRLHAAAQHVGFATLPPSL